MARAFSPSMDLNNELYDDTPPRVDRCIAEAWTYSAADTEPAPCGGSDDATVLPDDVSLAPYTMRNVSIAHPRTRVHSPPHTSWRDVPLLSNGNVAQTPRETDSFSFGDATPTAFDDTSSGNLYGEPIWVPAGNDFMRDVISRQQEVQTIVLDEQSKRHLTAIRGEIDILSQLICARVAEYERQMYPVVTQFPAGNLARSHAVSPQFGTDSRDGAADFGERPFPISGSPRGTDSKDDRAADFGERLHSHENAHFGYPAPNVYETSAAEGQQRGYEPSFSSTDQPLVLCQDPTPEFSRYDYVPRLEEPHVAQGAPSTCGSMRQKRVDTSSPVRTMVGSLKSALEEAESELRRFRPLGAAVPESALIFAAQHGWVSGDAVDRWTDEFVGNVDALCDRLEAVERRTNTSGSVPRVGNRDTISPRVGNRDSISPRVGNRDTFRRLKSPTEALRRNTMAESRKAVTPPVSNAQYLSVRREVTHLRSAMTGMEKQIKLRDDQIENLTRSLRSLCGSPRSDKRPRPSMQGIAQDRRCKDIRARPSMQGIARYTYGRRSAPATSRTLSEYVLPMPDISRYR